MAEASRRAILVVDDEPDVRSLIRLLVEQAPDLEVVAEAVDGPDALQFFDHFKPPPVPHVVILDNQMPDMTGLEVARRMLEKVPHQRIVLFTAFVDDRVRAEARQIGIADVISKTEVGRLVEAVRSV